jgi:hypothetical protein
MDAPEVGFAVDSPLSPQRFSGFALRPRRLQWTEQLGNAFLAQQADVMAAVQSLRHETMAAGNLKQTPQCRCVIQTSGETISILPAEPHVVCVPVYSPAVYGAWPYPAYPPYSFPIPAGFAYEPGFWIGFGPPIVLASLGPLWGWGWVDWVHDDIALPVVARPSRAAYGYISPPIAAVSLTPTRRRERALMLGGFPR